MSIVVFVTELNPHTPDPNRPIVAKKRAQPQFLSTTLVLEVFAVLFATVVAVKFSGIGKITLSIPAIWSYSAVVMVLLLVASRLQTKPLGIYFGAVLQATLVVMGLFVDLMIVVAVVFIGLWIASYFLGQKIDRERAEYDALNPGTAPNA